MSNISMIDSDMLKFAIENGMLDLALVQEKIEMQKRNQLLEKHKYDIWQGTNGKWYTYLPDEEKGRVLKKRTSEKAIEDLIVNYYVLNLEENKRKNKSKSITLVKIFPEWINYKQAHTDSTSYINKIIADWKKFYATDKEISNTPLSKFTKIELDNWAHNIIKKYDMTKKTYYNMSIILRQCLDYAVELGYIEKNVFSEVKVNTKMFRRTKKKKGDTEVYTYSEEERIIEDMVRRYNNNPTSAAPLAVIFAFETGLRVGELCALKMEDINGDYIQIQRQEVRDYERVGDFNMRTKGYRIVEYTKSDDGYREIYLTQTAKRIINLSIETNKVNGGFYNPDGFLFCRSNGENVNHYSIKAMLTEGCKHVKMQLKTSHKIRKTFISSLIDGGINIDEVRRIAGHSDERTTYGNYCYNRLTDKQTEAKLELISSKKTNVV